MSLDLHKTKERRSIILDLKKRNGIEGQKAEVILCLDYSGSMAGLYTNGTCQATVERILPLGLAFDDNQQVDFYLFDDGYQKLPENLTLSNTAGYINGKVIGKYQMGSTNYAPVLKRIYKDYSTSGTRKYPVYIIFITDGENFDPSQTEDIIRTMSNEGFFIQFVGIGNETFRFLTKLDGLSGRKIDNANFFRVPNLNTTSDEELYRLMMAEFPGWLNQARNLSMIE